MSELIAFAGLHQALARLCLRDGRPRKEIADAADINASMLSGFCSGRRVPSIEHLDKLLTTLGMGIEELTYELRAVAYRSKAGEGPVVLWPQFLGKEEGQAAATVLTALLEDVRDLLQAQSTDRPRSGSAAAASPASAEAEPREKRSSRGRPRRTAAQEPGEETKEP